MSCSLWFTAELNANDHIEGIHKFKEGEGMSFYECLRRHGDRMVRQPEVFRPTKGDQPGHLDGHGAGAPVWIRAEEFVHNYQQPRVRSVEEIFQGGGNVPVKLPIVRSGINYTII